MKENILGYKRVRICAFEYAKGYLERKVTKGKGTRIIMRDQGCFSILSSIFLHHFLFCFSIRITL